MVKKISALITAAVMTTAVFVQSVVCAKDTRTLTNPGENMLVFDSGYGGNIALNRLSLLETNEEGELFVLASQEIGLGRFNPVADDLSYDVNNVNSMAWFLNNEESPWVIESKDDNADAFTSELLGRTSANTYHTLIPGMWDLIIEKDWSRITLDEDNKQITETVRAKIGFLSVDEYNEYAYGGKIGYAGNNTANRSGYRFWLRDSVYADSVDKIRAFAAYEHVTGDPGTVICYAPNWSEGRIRPCFWLSRELFTSLKLDLVKTGAKVLEAMKSVCSYNELAESGLYSEEELASLYTDESIKVESITVDGDKKVPGYMLTAVHGDADGIQDGDETEYLYQWKCEGVNIDGATEKSFMIQNAQAEKSISVAVTPVIRNSQGLKYGGTAESEEVLIGAGVKRYGRQSGDVVTKSGGTSHTKDNPKEFLFSVANGSSNIAQAYRTFSLLDISEDEDSKYFVMAASKTVSGAFDKDDNYQNKFDPEKEGSMAYYLKYGYYGGRNVAEFENVTSVSGALHPAVKEYIDEDRQWLTAGTSESTTTNGNVEKGKFGTAGPDDYVVTTPVAILSVDEYAKYADRFGYYAGGMSWYLRTSAQVPYIDRVVTPFDGELSRISEVYVTATYDCVRPVFWLKDNFFMNVKCDVETMGQAVKNEILGRYTFEEMLGSEAGYTEEELKEIGYTGERVMAENVRICGITAYGQLVSGEYEYSNSNNAAEKMQTYQWYASSEEDGTYTAIEGAVGKTFRIENSPGVLYIRLGVTPKDSMGIGVTEFLSEAYEIAPAMPVTVYISDLSETEYDAENTVKTEIEAEITCSEKINGAVIIAAVYDADNTMIASGVSKHESLTSGSYSLATSEYNKDDAVLIRVMVWNGFENIQLYYSEEFEA